MVIRPDWVPPTKYEFLGIKVREHVINPIKEIKPECRSLSEFCEILLFIGFCEYRDMHPERSKLLKR